MIIIIRFVVQETELNHLVAVLYFPRLGKSVEHRLLRMSGDLNSDPGFCPSALVVARFSIILNLRWQA